MKAMKRMILTLVLLPLLAATSMVISVLFPGSHVIARAADPVPPEGTLQATPLVTDVDPFALTLTAYKDTWVNEATPNTNYGAELELTLSTGSGGHGMAFILLDFDLSALPADAQVISATLSVYSLDTAVDAYAILPYAITSGWNESTATWNTQPTASHRGDTPVMHVPDGWTVFDVTNIIQDWHDGALFISGIALDPEAPSSGSRIFQARNTATPPELTVYYTRRAELAPIQDTWVGHAQPSSPHGADPVLQVISPDHSEQEARALLGFDFASLPDDIAVISASLAMYSKTNRKASVNETALVADLYADAILGTWDESTTTWNNAPASLYLGDPPAQAVSDDWTTWDVTNLVQSWADQSLAPYGILLRVGPETAHAYGFWSRDTSEPPELLIEYGAAPPDCNPITSIDVSGATSGITGVEYTFAVNTSPGDADPPASVGWDVTDYPERLYGGQISLTWATPGEKTLVVVVSHCGGSTATVHTIQIGEPPPDCAAPLKYVGLTGPMLVETGTAYQFRASVSPNWATDPLTYTWEATGHTPAVYVTSASYTEVPYTWNDSGSKVISVTVENCGGTATAYHDVEVVAPADLPDLVISTAWNEVEQERVGYVIHNQGNTAVPPGFYVALEKGPNIPALLTHPDPLAPGGIGIGFLEHAWTCSGPDETVGVLADWNEDIVELDELNNRWGAIWACDWQEPTITSGPTVVNISESRAQVQWTTDEDCEASVEYGFSPYAQGLNQPGTGGYYSSHMVTLNGLTAAATYYARAFCTDRAGLTVNSEPVWFETAPEGSDPPEIRSVSVGQYPSSMYEFWEVQVELEDDAFMDRVECSMDGTPLGAAYGADTSGPYPVYSLYLLPYALGLTRAQFFTAHSFSCTAYRQYPSAFHTMEVDRVPPGSTQRVIALVIDEPPPDHTLYADGPSVPPGTRLDAVVHAAAYEWACTHSGFSEGDLVPPGLEAVSCSSLEAGEVEQIELWIAGQHKDTVVPAPDELLNNLTADVGGLNLGTHELKVVAMIDGGSKEATQNLIVEAGEAGLEINRYVVRYGTTLEIKLILHNAGTATVNVERLVDNVIGLQPILKRQSLGPDSYGFGILANDFLADGSGVEQKFVSITFDVPQPGDLSYLDIRPGDTITIKYDVVPVLSSANRVPLIGTIFDPLEVWIYDGGPTLVVETYLLPGTLVYDPLLGFDVPLDQAVADAIGEADYLAVTNHSRVYGMLANTSPDRDAEVLFSNMAELASLKNGVLGFLSLYDTQQLDERIEPGGLWAEALNPAFNAEDDGFVLLVGEAEIIPSFYVDGFDTSSNLPDAVEYSDLWYADTSGQTARPELVVGRVIGNGLTELNTYLENMIHAARGDPGYGFHSTASFVTNGGGDGHDTFKGDALEAHAQLGNSYDDTVWADMGSVISPTQRAYYQSYLPDRDLVMYRGHGSRDSWAGLAAHHVNIGMYDLGDTNPVMFAAACQTGNYESDNDLNLAELLLKEGAGVYIGATVNSARSVNSKTFVNFKPNWQLYESVGQALNQLKRAAWTWDSDWEHDKLWVYEYNLYGDPKYGSLDTFALASEGQPEAEIVSVSRAPEATTISVALPALEFSEAEGNDVVRIPGGAWLGEKGGYPVPVWALSVAFRPGHEVQDVQLSNRHSLEAIGDLSLPLTAPAIDGALSPDVPADPAAPRPGSWYPTHERRFDWSVDKGPDGSSTLYILLYPFYYDPGTGDALYYRKHQLAVTTFTSSARIQALDGPSRGNELGQPVHLDLVVSRTGLPADLVVQASVRTRATDQIVGGLPLKTLHDLVGTASLDLAWDTRPYAAGAYMIVVELFDTAGHLLDTAATDVWLGTHGARLTGLTASQDYYAPGDLVTLSLGVRNTGTVPISGTAVFLIQEVEDLSATEVITAPVSRLDPGMSVKVGKVWNTTRFTANGYRVLAYFKFFSQTTEPRDLFLYRPRVFLPLVRRNR
jgi:hypothetical protein